MEEHRPDHGVATVDHQHRALREGLLAGARDVCRVHRHLEIPEFLVELHPLGRDRAPVLLDGATTLVAVARVALRRSASASRNSRISDCTASATGRLAPRIAPSMSTWIVACSAAGRQ